MENQKDHDLLIRLDQKVDALSADIRELKDNLAGRVSHLEEGTMTRQEVLELKNTADTVHTDHEERIRLLEQAKWQIIGWASAVAALFSFIGTEVIHKVFGQ